MIVGTAGRRGLACIDVTCRTGYAVTREGMRPWGGAEVSRALTVRSVRRGGSRMLRREENELLVHTGPDTPMGQYLRRFWTPVLLASELPGPDCPPVRVRVMGERLIAFRDSLGRIGLLDE